MSNCELIDKKKISFGFSHLISKSQLKLLSDLFISINCGVLPISYMLSILDILW